MDIKTQITQKTDYLNQLTKLYKQLNNSQKYTDHQFPPNIQSLIKHHKNYQGEWDIIKWNKIEVVDFGSIKLLQIFSPQKLSSGRIKTNSFLNIMQILSQKPQLIKRIFEIKQNNNQLYAIWIFNDGKWDLITIDPNLPIEGNYDKKLLFSQIRSSIGVDLWISLLEKAYAKYLGSYYKTLYNNEIQMIENITGLPYVKLPIFNIKELWKQIKEFLNKNFLIICCFKEENGINKMFRIDQYKEEPLQKYILINDEYWQNFENQDWMTLSNLQKNFDEVIAFKYYENYYYNFETISEKYENIIFMYLEQDTHLFLSLYQQDPRLFDKYYDLSYFRITIIKVDGEVEFVYSTFQCDRNIQYEKLLKKGKYLLLIDPTWSNKIYKYNLSTYSSNMISLQSVTYNYNKLELLAWKSFSQKFPNQLIDKQQNQILQNDFIIKEHFNEQLGIQLYYLVNKSENKSIKQLYEISLQGFKTANHINHNVLEIIVQQNNSAVIFLKQNLQKKQTYFKIKLIKEGILVDEYQDDRIRLNLEPKEPIVLSANTNTNTFQKTPSIKKKKNKFWIF